MQAIIETLGGTVCALGIGMLFLVLFAAHIARISGGAGGRSPLSERREVEPHDTFTNEELEMYGVDGRSKHARNQIEFSKYAEKHGMLPMQQYGRYVAGMEKRRRVFGKDDAEIVDGEVVNPELGSGRNQKRLKG
jgi:hypothetical protein